MVHGSWYPHGHYECNGWDVCMNGTTSVPKSILRYSVDKVRQESESEVCCSTASYVQKVPNKSLSHELNSLLLKHGILKKLVTCITCMDYLMSQRKYQYNFCRSPWIQAGLEPGTFSSRITRSAI